MRDLKYRILIVDDDPSLVDFLKLLLESEGYETYDASDGKMALDEIAEINPELVLLDYMMPNMHGLDVLRKVVKNFTSSFVVMLTGKGSEDVAVECMKAGAADYVVKPFDNEHLLGVVRSVLRLRDSEIQKHQLDIELQDVNHRLQQYVGELEKRLKEWTTKQTEIESFVEKALKILEETDQSDRVVETVLLLARIRETLKRQGS